MGVWGGKGRAGHFLTSQWWAELPLTVSLRHLLKAFALPSFPLPSLLSPPLTSPLPPLPSLLSPPHSSPCRAKFLQQLKQLVHQRDAIMADTSLQVQEREAQLAALTLPRLEENLPDSRLEDLW